MRTKQLNCLGLVALLSGAFYGCNNGSTGCPVDSVAVVKQYSRNHPGLVGVAPTIDSTGIVSAQKYYPKNVLDSMRWLYRTRYEFPIPNWEHPDLGWATGFVMDPIDYDSLLALGARVKTIGFHFGIRNYPDVLNQGAVPIYTMMIIPIGIDDSMVTAFRPGKSIAMTGNGDGYDFVQPCPGSSGCPN